LITAPVRSGLVTGHQKRPALLKSIVHLGGDSISHLPVPVIPASLSPPSVVTEVTPSPNPMNMAHRGIEDIPTSLDPPSPRRRHGRKLLVEIKDDQGNVVKELVQSEICDISPPVARVNRDHLPTIRSPLGQSIQETPKIPKTHPVSKSSLS
jgi:hypothetical protein